MNKWTARCGPAAVVLAISGPAMADVTGMQVWENWVSVAEGMGQVLTPGEVAQAGDTLSIRDLDVTMEAPDVDVSGSIALIEFRDRADGTVEITFSPNYTMTVESAPEMGEAATVTMAIGQAGMTVVASDVDGAIAYDFIGPEISVDVTSLLVEGQEQDFDFDMTMLGVSGRYLLASGDMPEMTSRLNADEVAVDLNAVDPDSGETVAFEGRFTDLAGTSDGTFVAMANYADFAEMLRAGFTTETALSHGPAEYALAVTGPDSFNLVGSAESGSLDVGISADALLYAVSNTGYSISVSGADIPMPEIAAEADEVGFGILMPVAASEEPQEFGVTLTLDGLSVSDMLWSMFDPGGTLPRDPATLIVDLSGEANWLVDIMDTAAQAEMGDSVPGEIHALTLEDLVVALAGARLTGNGSFTFDNDDLETFEGMPAPDGSIQLRLEGANALIDNLVAMGLLPEDQAMGARMMMGMFARPGDGEDTLVSTIQVNPDGSILANGQRLK